MQTFKLPLPCKKVLLSQVTSKNLRTANSFFSQNNNNEKYGIRMATGKVLYFTNVWVQGLIVELNNVDGKAVLQIEDGTGTSNVIGLEKIIARNIFLEKEFMKGMHIMVTGVLLQSTGDIPFIKANRISELPAKCMEGWLTEVETFQHHFSLNI